MQSMSVQAGQLHASADKLRSDGSQIDGALRDLDNKVSKLRSQWGGEAQTAYDTAQREWTASADRFRELLSAIASGTDEMADQYTADDARGAGRFGG